MASKIQGASRRDYFVVPVDQILIDDKNYRATGDVSALAKSIAAKGIEEPVRARAEGGKLHLVDGYRRMAAVALLASQGVVIERVPVILQEKSRQTDHELLLTRLVLNSHRKDATPLETAKAVDQAITVVGCTAEEVADRLGWELRDVHKHLKLLEAAPRVQQALAKGEIGMAAAHEIITKYPDRKAQEEALEIAKSTTKLGRVRVTGKAVHKAAPRVRRARRTIRLLQEVQKAFDEVKGELALPKGTEVVRAEAEGFHRGLVESLKWVLGGEKTW